MLSRTDRQKLCIKRWIEAGGCNTIVASTGFGILLTGLLYNKFYFVNLYN